MRSEYLALEDRARQVRRGREFPCTPHALAVQMGGILCQVRQAC